MASQGRPLTPEAVMLGVGFDRRKHALVGLAGLVVWLGAAAPAAAAPIVYTIDPPNSPGVDVAVGCTSFSCSLATQVLTLSGGPAEVSGTITIDTVANLLSFDLAATVTLTGSANGVSTVGFVPVNYDATNVALTPMGGGQFQVAGASVTNTTGNIEEEFVLQGPFSAPSALLSGSCTVVSGGTVCGFTVGGLGFGVGIGNPDQTIYFRHTMNLAAVPEPAAALFLGMGLAALGLVRRNAA